MAGEHIGHEQSFSVGDAVIDTEESAEDPEIWYVIEPEVVQDGQAEVRVVAEAWLDEYTGDSWHTWPRSDMDTLLSAYVKHHWLALSTKTCAADQLDYESDLPAGLRESAKYTEDSFKRYVNDLIEDLEE